MIVLVKIYTLYSLLYLSSLLACLPPAVLLVDKVLRTFHTIERIALQPLFD
jgi:hypothetical protein